MIRSDVPQNLSDTSNRTEIGARKEEFWRMAQNAANAFQYQANIDMRYEAGDQTLWNDYYGSMGVTAPSKPFYFNIIRKIINTVSGNQRKNRKSSTAIPVENGDQITADHFTKCFMYINKQEGVLETISEAFHHALITGISLLQVWTDYRNDPVNGDIRVSMCAYNEFIIDPFFTKKDLSDCSGILKRSYLSKQDCIALMGDHYSEKILALPASQTGTNFNEKFPFLPQNYNVNYNQAMAYDEFYYRDYREQILLVDSDTGETKEWGGTQDELDIFLERFPNVYSMKATIPTVKLAIFIQNECFYDGANLEGIDTYPFVPVLAYYRPAMATFENRIAGITRSLRDCQFLFNRRMIALFDYAESIATGYIYKVSALVDPLSIFMTGNGRGIAVQDQANISDVQQIQPPHIPPSWFQGTDMLQQLFFQITGANEEFTAAATDNKAGILEMMRQESSRTTFQDVFDNLDAAQKILYDIILKKIQVSWTPGKVKAVLEGEEPTQEFYNSTFGKYHAVVEDGINTSTQRQMQLAQLLHLREVGVPIPAEQLLEASTIQNKNKIIEAIKQQEQQQQQLQMKTTEMLMQQQIVEIEKLKAEIKDINARRFANIGLGEERISRVSENRSMAVERVHRANAEDQRATLDLVKTLKDLESIDIAHLEKLLNMTQTLKQSQSQISEEGVGEVARMPVGIESNQLSDQESSNNSMPMGANWV